MVDEDNESMIKIKYACPFHNENHVVEIKEVLLKSQEKFPFTYVTLHGTEEGLDDILTTLYIDAKGRVRSVDQKLIGDDNIVSKNQLKEMVTELVDLANYYREEYEKVRKENIKFRKLLQTLPYKHL
jgi:hypothetical protein